VEDQWVWRHRTRILDSEGRELRDACLACPPLVLHTRTQLARWTSAGGLVIRTGAEDAGFEVALVGRGRPTRWALPKGTLRPSESPEAAAVREVEEETGLEVRLLCPLEQIRYTFHRNGVGYAKTVDFYLMHAVGGDTSHHDDEYEFAGWFSLAGAVARIAYPNEARLVEQAAVMLEVDGQLVEQISLGGA
jgi:8-oxo-dGTP pyrophosphatase MutT (NUDIX family)